jgi:hypothetical protein
MEHRPFPENATKPPQSRFSWPLVAILSAAAMLAVIIQLIPNVNKAATNNPDSGTPLLRISALSLAPQEIAGEANVDVYGQATNTAARAISGASVSGTFKDRNGVSIYEEQRPVERVSAERKNADVNAGPLEQDPIKPGQTMVFRVRFDQVPAEWNHQPPDITLLKVTQQ